MRKEKLLKKKEELAANMVWYMRDELLNHEEIKSFSLAQLEILKRVFDSAEKRRERHETFHSLSVNEVVHCETGKIIYVSDKGDIYEETENDIRSGASRSVYESYKDRTSANK